MEGSAEVQNVCGSEKEELCAVRLDREVLLRWAQIKEAERLGSDSEMACLLFKWYESCHPSQWFVECVSCKMTLSLSLVCEKPCHTHTATVSVGKVAQSAVNNYDTGTQVKGRSLVSSVSGDVFSVRHTVDESVNLSWETAQEEIMLGQDSNSVETDFYDEDDGDFEGNAEVEPHFGEQKVTYRSDTVSVTGNAAAVKGQDVSAECWLGGDEERKEQQQCSQMCPSLTALSLHSKTMHDAKENSLLVKCKTNAGDEGAVFEGGISGKSFSSKSQVESLAGVDGSKPHCCDICQKRFKSFVTLGVHRLKFHSAAKPCSKDQGDAASTLEADWNRKKTPREEKPFSREEKPFACVECGLSFKKANHLSSHQKLAHSLLTQAEGKKKNMCCKICQRSFRLRRSLTLHMKCHSETTCHGGQQETCGELTLNDQITAPGTQLMDIAQGIDTSTAGESPHKQVHTPQFSCNFCERRFKSKGGLQGHKQREHSKQWSKVNKCDKCEEVFRFKSQLTKHKRSHRDERPFSCGQCGAKFKSSASLGLHKSWHEDMRSAVCHLCGKSCLGLRSLTRHIKMQHGTEHMVDKPYKCSDCTASFSSLSKLTAHAGVHSHQQNFLCGQCGQAFRSQHILDIHTRRHTGEKPFQCGECEERFIDKSRLKRHQLQHKPASQELCHICGAGFPSKAHLAFHIQRHTTERRFSCGQCGKAYKTTGDLKSHMMSHCDDRPFPCPHCPYAARTKAMLNKHARKHTGEKPYRCEQCSAAFTYFSCLSAHRKLHSNSKPFVCPVCSAAFFTAYNLRLHSRKHSGEKPYRCTLCAESFSWHSGLKCHMRKHDAASVQRASPGTAD